MRHSNSSAKELRQRAKIFRRWADETDFPEMREAFLSLAAGITDRLLCSVQSRSGAIQSAARFSPRKVSTLRGRLTSIVLRIDPWHRKDYNRPTAHLHPKGGP
jgi:hypothetical protein